jgi:hypothetical protein
MSAFGDWDGSNDASAFLLPGEDGYVSAEAGVDEAPLPVEAVDPAITAVRADPEEALEVIRQSAQQEQAYTELQRNLVVSEAVRQYEEGEEDPDVIADQLRNRYGYEVAAQFVQHWHAEDTQWDEPESQVPETAVEWAEREAQVLTYKQSLAELEQMQQANAQQAQLDVEINQAFNKGIQEIRARHAALSKGRAGVTSAELFAVIGKLVENVDPRTPDEARQLAESSYRQAVEMTRAMKEADLVASFETPQEREIRLGFMPGADERREIDNAVSVTDERLNRFVEAVDPSRFAPRPTLAQQLHAEFDAHEARTRALEDAFQLNHGDSRTDPKKKKPSRRTPQTASDGWNV